MPGMMSGPVPTARDRSRVQPTRDPFVVSLQDRRTNMKTTFAAWLGLLLAATSPCQADDPPRTSSRAANAAEPAVRSDEEKAIRAEFEAFGQAFQKGDAGAIAALFTEEGEAIGVEGETIQGRKAIQEHYASRFAEGAGDRFTTTIESIRPIAPGIVRVQGRSQITPSGGGPPVHGRFTVIEVKREERWLAASVRELPGSELSHYEHLKELEWLVGDWVEESESAVVVSSVGWADNRSFLLRSFEVRVTGKPALTGTQRIGWDPLTKQIKSWVFDSQGGYGDGLWMRSGNQWVIKATGVRADGRTATATQVLTYLNNETLRWKSIDRTLGSEIRGDVDEIIMVRKPPQPR
jgi:uncharacterized protein (TIGR02246 family)